MQNTIYILGVDPGLVHTGWGIVAVDGNSYTHIGNGTIKTSAKSPIHCRLLHIDKELGTVIRDRLVPYMASAQVESAIEDVFINANSHLSLKLGMAQGVAMVAMARAGLQVASYQNRIIKKSLTGSGRADKGQMDYMVKILLGAIELHSEHSADALAIALTHAHMRTQYPQQQDIAT